mmetsp:Transcript_38222/g.110289  ORF Transcript_38222/g.110289 Transcript_38222/m.110289 type:complete len:200 (+) Transcript_38222:1266-1865(+)
MTDINLLDIRGEAGHGQLMLPARERQEQCTVTIGYTRTGTINMHQCIPNGLLAARGNDSDPYRAEHKAWHGDVFDMLLVALCERFRMVDRILGHAHGQPKPLRRTCVCGAGMPKIREQVGGEWHKLSLGLIKLLIQNILGLFQYFLGLIKVGLLDPDEHEGSRSRTPSDSVQHLRCPSKDMYPRAFILEDVIFQLEIVR